MADIDYAAIGNEFLEGFKASTEPHLGQFQSWAQEDQDWLKEQAKVSADLLKDMAHCVKAGDEENIAVIKDAMEQHASTLKLRLVRRRWQASEAAKEAAGDALEAGLKIALKVALSLLTGGLAL